MQILELETRSGLDRATIRHYEKEGLISPIRQSNGYRDYSDADLQHLQKIKLLRQLGMSLEKIRHLQQGSEVFASALSEQLQTLDTCMVTYQRARAICQEMLDNHTSYESMDAESYYQKLMTAEVNKPTAQYTYHEPAAEGDFHPYRRFIARWFDYTLITTILELLIYVVFRVRPYSELLTNIILFCVPLLAVPILALMLNCFGTTPGKWMMGIEVLVCDYAEALEREWQVVRYGYGFGIPIYMYYRLYRSYRDHKDGFLEWECCGESIYYKRNTTRKIVFSVSVIAVILASVLCFNDLSKPKYRGDLTIAEFSSNYNCYLESTKYDNPIDHYLDETGNWKKDDDKDGIIVENPPLGDLTFYTEGETITKLTYDQAWNQVQYWVNPFGRVPQVIVRTMISSQRQISNKELNNYIREFTSCNGEETGNLKCGNIEIRWSVTSVNCEKTVFGYTAIEDAEESSIEFHLEITVH